MEVTKPYKFIGFGDIHGPGSYEFIRFRWAFISQTPVLEHDTNLPSLRINNKNYSFCLVFGRLPAELGPETRSNGSGSRNGAESTQT